MRGDRQRMIWRLGELMEQKAQELARVESENTGKPFQYLSLGIDIPGVIDHLRFFAACTRDTFGDEAGEYLPNYTSYFRSEPVGVVGTDRALELSAGDGYLEDRSGAGRRLHAGAETCAGNSFDHFNAGRTDRRSRLPCGSGKCITGDNATGQSIVEHPDIRLISLTGSTAAGKKVMATASASLKRVHFELGGKAPFLVFDDADSGLVARKPRSPHPSTPGRIALRPLAFTSCQANRRQSRKRWWKPCARSRWEIHSMTA